MKTGCWDGLIKPIRKTIREELEKQKNLLNIFTGKCNYKESFNMKTEH